MSNAVRFFAVLALGLAAAPSFAADGFDGAGSLSLPSVQAVRPPEASEAAPAAAPRSRNADLYYFNPAEAAQVNSLGWWPWPKKPANQKGWTFDDDVPAAIQQQMRDDLAFMAGIAGAGATALHRKIFGLVDGPTYKKFFDDRVTGIGMNSCGDGKAVACVIPFRGASKMWLTQNYIKFSHPQVARMMVVYHEARHTESRNGNWPHASCPDPFLGPDGNEIKSIWTGNSLGGEPACDETPFGSYGSSTIMLKNIQKFCANCNDKVKMDAGLYADDQMKRIINPEAKKQMEDDFNQ